MIEVNDVICISEGDNHGDEFIANVMLEHDGYLCIEDSSDDNSWLSLNLTEQVNLMKILMQLHGDKL